MAQQKEKVMIDIETFSQDVFTAPMVSLAAVKFNKSGEILDRFMVNIDYADLKSYGFVAQQDCINWWKGQDPKVFEALKENKQILNDALNQFSNWYGTVPLQTWANGIDFDFVILKNHYKKCKKPLPWKYYHQADYRTILSIFDIRNSDIGKKITHNPIDDCIHQVETLIKIIGPLWNEQ